MASPLRSWSLPRLGRAGGAGRRPRAAAAAVPACARGVEALERRQLFAASLVSVNADELSGASGNSTDPDLSSRDGRYVVFTSTGTNLSPQDTSATADIYLRDTQLGTTRLVSVNSLGNGGGNGASTDPSVSDDGRYVVFTSVASNLVVGDTNGASDVFVRDVFANTTRLVSARATSATLSGNGASLQGTISDNGRFVAFASDATNITANDTTPTRDVFLRDLSNNSTQLVSLNAFQTGGGNANSQDPYVSKHGNFVSFVSAATDLSTTTFVAPGPGNNVYLFNSGYNVDDPGFQEGSQFGATPTITLVSTNGGGGSGGGADVGTGGPVVTEDGNLVAFSSTAADFVGGDVNGVSDVYLKNLTTNEILLISRSSAGDIGNGPSTDPTISNNGNRVAFESTASNLHPQDTGAGSDVFVRDVRASTTTLASTNQARTGAANGAFDPVLEDSGILLAFSSTSNNLVAEPVTGSQVYLGTFNVPDADFNAPRAQIANANPEQQLAATTLSFTINYIDDGVIDTGTIGQNDVFVTGPNGFREQASQFSVNSTTGNEAIVVYTVAAPTGNVSQAINGTYTVTIRANQVADVNRNFVPGGTVGTFNVNVGPGETVLPTPTFSGGSPAVGAATYEFTVIYSERGGIDFATFGNDDIVVTGPNGYSQNAALVASSALSATTTAVVYRITAPGGTWDAVDAGVYTASVLPGGVSDVRGNTVAAGAIGQFSALGPDLVAIPLRNLRSGAISGVDEQRARIRILNLGSSPSTVPVAVTLYTSLDQTLDAGDATIGTFIEERPINPDDFNEMRVRFIYPQVSAGNYFVIAQVDSANAVVEQSESNNVAASTRQVGLSAPFVDLVPTLVPFSGNRSRLGTNEARIRIRNAGNVEVDADVVAAISAVSDVTPTPSERAIANVPLRVTLRPGESRSFRLPFTFPQAFERGQYRLVATIDATNVIAERDESNNRVISLASFNFA